MSDRSEHIPGWFPWAGFRYDEVDSFLTLETHDERGHVRRQPYIRIEDVERVTGQRIGTHIHQQQCFVDQPHPEHITPLGVYDNVAYYYRCLGKETTDD